MKSLKLLAAATCLALPIAAHAQPVTGPYVNLGAGTSIIAPYSNTTSLYFPNTGNTASVGGKILTIPAFAGVFSAGYGMGNGFRGELQGNFYRNTLKKDDLSNGVQVRAHGLQNTYGVMVNALYDVDAGIPIFPYVGAGAGYQWVKYNHATINGVNHFGGTKGSFAYQIIAGVAYPIAMVPGLSVTAEYRFMRLTGGRSYSISSAYNGNTFTNRVGPENTHTMLLGLRYQLFQPAPPPPPPAPAPVAAPAPPPAKTYLVFFDWDKYNLTPRATQIIAQAAQDSKTQSVTTIQVSGYTDTSGTPQYNMGLSVRRAKAVASQLVADGVPASAITAQGFGETHLLVPTGDGVREPQNRRVEIVFK